MNEKTKIIVYLSFLYTEKFIFLSENNKIVD